MHGQGGEIGPDLTGAGRDNIDYLLENIVDPGATVSADFRMVVVAMQDGRVLNGLIKEQSARTLTLQTQTEAIHLDRSEIEAIRPSLSSLMPDGLLDATQAGRGPRPDRLPVASDAGPAGGCREALAGGAAMSERLTRTAGEISSAAALPSRFGSLRLSGARWRPSSA